MRRPYLLILLLLLTTTGCYKSTFVNDTLLPTNEEDSTRTPYFLWGIVGDGEVDTRTYCKYDAYKITFVADPLDVVVSTITLGILSLRSVQIECGAPAVRKPSFLEGGQ
jgi:hypothetical protein